MSNDKKEKKVEVPLGNDYFIIIDKFNHTLVKRTLMKHKKTGAFYTTDRPINYYKNVELAISAYINHSILSELPSHSEELHDFLEVYEKCLQKMVSMVECALIDKPVMENNDE